MSVGFVVTSEKPSDDTSGRAGYDSDPAAARTSGGRVDGLPTLNGLLSQSTKTIQNHLVFKVPSTTSTPSWEVVGCS